jgi:hypothetical protein
MAQDPLSRVASWLTPVTADPPPADDVDPVFALIAEVVRLDALAIEAQTRGDKIFDALPEDIRKGLVRVSLSGELGRLLQHSGFASEVALHRWVDVHRRFVMAFVDDATAAEFDRQIGFDQALAQFRAGREEIKTIREASGCEAHYREAEALGQQAGKIVAQIGHTKPVTLAGAIAMLEWGHEDGCCDECLINTAIAGLHELASLREAPAIDAGAGQAPGESGAIMTADSGGAQPEVIGSGDADFLAIEQRLAELKVEREALIREHYPMTIAMEDELIINGVDVQIDRLEDAINETAPQTLVGAAVKLRGLADPSQLLCDPLGCTSARQVLGLVERLIMAGSSEATIITTAPDDSRILSLFREWVAARRAADVLYGEDGESDEYKASAEAVEKIESALIEVPSNGAIGFAIKSYLALHADGADYDDGAALSDYAINWEVDAAILKDAIRFVPELGQLAAAALTPQPAGQEAGDEGCAAALDADDEAGIGEGDGPEASPIAAPAEAKRELTEAERDLAETFIIWPLTAAQERFAAAVDELQQRSRRRAADAAARLEGHGATVFDADSEVIGFGELDDGVAA